MSLRIRRCLWSRTAHHYYPKQHHQHSCSEPLGLHHPLQLLQYAQSSAKLIQSRHHSTPCTSQPSPIITAYQTHQTHLPYRQAMVAGAFAAGVSLGLLVGYTYPIGSPALTITCTPASQTTNVMVSHSSMLPLHSNSPDTELDLYNLTVSATDSAPSWATSLTRSLIRPTTITKTAVLEEPAPDLAKSSFELAECSSQVPHGSKDHGRPTSASSAVGGAFIADAVEHVIESVVNISVETEVASFFDRKTLISSGSGFFVSGDGKILTNAHVVADMNEDSKLWVTATDGIRYPGIVHSLDTLSDLAIVRIQALPSPQRWPTVKFGTNKNLRPGDWVIAIGSPFGLQNTVTAGVVSSRSRLSSEIGTKDTRVEYIQTDCVVHSGSSGGPLVNLDGQVVGINTTRAESEGISFAIRVDNAMDMIRQLVVEGRVTRPWLGIRMITLTPHVYAQLGKDATVVRGSGADGMTAMSQRLPHVASGVLVANVEARSPASRGGLLGGDVIIAVDEVMIHSSQELLKHIGLRVGEPFAMRVRRCVPTLLDDNGIAVQFGEEERVVSVIPDALDMFVQSDMTSELL
ncbi:hypothetical protein BASA61_002370 [Batrachochytrium salamandrivorans]|nr:hypothetical protein BASA61_002370 [Batrachochytrium salamandrivorans]